MDVFIPEEYVIRRRLEKREASMAEKRSKTVLEASHKQDMDSKSVPLLFGRPDGNGFLVSSGNKGVLDKHNRSDRTGSPKRRGPEIRENTKRRAIKRATLFK
ncbi:hypothetical protein GQ457_07G009140 [Hibiscus cannabinus]